MKTVAIVGSEPHTKDLAPYDDLSIDIWMMNQSIRLSKRVTAAFQIHDKAIYRDPENKYDKEHWPFLQQDHGYPVYLQDADPDVPNSVRYPLKEIMEAYPCEKQMFTQTACYLLALALYQGYERVLIYGIENAHYSEYAAEREGFIYWVGFLQGHGVIVERHSGDNMFDNPLYGREHLWEQNVEFFTKRILSFEVDVRKLTNKLKRDSKKPFEVWNKTLYEIGLAEGQKQQCEKYLELIKRQIQETGKAVLVPSELVLDRYDLNILLLDGGREMAKMMGKNDVDNYSAAALQTAVYAGMLTEIDFMQEEADKWLSQVD